MKWPWKRKAAAADRVVVASSPDRLVYAWCDAAGRLKGCGLEERGRDSPPDFQRRLRALALPAQGGIAVLPLADAQLMQVEAPAVKPEELKAAARWRVKDQVEGRLDDMTIDVMVVGEDKPRPNRHLFVAAARNTVIRESVDRARQAGVEVAVVDIAETAQRNLQSELAQAAGLAARATAALVRHGPFVLLTICAAGELYYARRIDWDAPLAAPPAPKPAPKATAALAFESADFVDYGADSQLADDEAPAGDAPRLVIELQRSFDLWERSWPDLPLAVLWVEVGAETDALLGVLGATLAQQVAPLDAGAAFPGFERLARTPAARAAVLPILGALLRSETRRL